MHRILDVPLRALLATALAAGSASALAANHTVTVGGSGLVFTPQVLNIAAGDTVTFTNAGGFHNAQSDAGAVTAFSTGAPSSDPWSSTVAFPTPGSIGYYCAIHGGPNGQGMSGTINVTVPVDLQSFDVD